MGSAEELPIFDCRLPIEAEIRHSNALNRQSKIVNPLGAEGV